MMVQLAVSPLRQVLFVCFFGKSPPGQWEMSDERERDSNFLSSRAPFLNFITSGYHSMIAEGSERQERRSRGIIAHKQQGKHRK